MSDIVQRVAICRLDLHNEYVRFCMVASPPERTRSGESDREVERLPVWGRLVYRWVPVWLARKLADEQGTP